MTLEGALDQLATWTITGVTVVGIDELSIPPGEADLPLLVPEMTGTGGETQKPLGINSPDGQVVVHVFHKMIFRGIGLSSHGERFSGLVPFMDLYFAAVTEDWTLDDNLMVSLTVADTLVGLVDVMGVLFYGVEFRHRWVLKV